MASTPSTTTIPHHRRHDDTHTSATLPSTPPRTPSPLDTPFKLLRPGTLVIAAFPNFYPVCYVRKPGPATAMTTTSTTAGIPASEEKHVSPHPRFAGLEVDLLLRFCAEHGLQAEIVAVPEFEGIWTYPTARLADVCIGGITVAPARTHPGLAWSDPYHHVRRTLVFNRRHPPKAGLPFPQGLEGVVRGVPGSTGFADAAARMCTVGKRAQLQDSTDDEADIQALLRGEIQGMMRGSTVGKAIVRRFPDALATTDDWDMMPELAPTPEGEVFCFPVRAESRLASALTAFLARQRASGALAQLLAKHQLA